MATPPLRTNFYDVGTPGSNDLTAEEYILNATRTDAAYDSITVVPVGPPNGSDDTAAIEAAWIAAGSGHAIQLGPGNYIYNGTGLDADSYGGHGAVLIAKGAGPNATNITLGASSYFFKPASDWIAHLVLEDIAFDGGKGAIKQTFTGVDTVGSKHINRVRFQNFTECAIASESSDSPFWYINECWFYAASSTNTIGIALGYAADVSTVTKCTFQKTRVDIKLHDGGGNVHIDYCDFLSNDTVNSGGPRIAVWAVPTDGQTLIAGQGFTISNSGFGAENLIDGDLWIVYADEGSGTSNGNKMPVLDADSTGIIAGHNIYGNYFLRAGMFADPDYSPPMIYSTTPWVQNINVHNNHIQDNIPYILEYRTVPTATQFSTTGNVFGPIVGYTDQFSLGPRISNDSAAGYTHDTGQTLQTRWRVVREHNSGSDPAYVELLTTAMASFYANGTDATLTAATDAYGGSDAATLRIINTGGNATVGTLSGSFVVGLPCWVEIDVAQPADTPLDGVRLYLFDDSFAAHWWKTVEIPPAAAGWITYAFSFVPRNTGSSPKLYIMGLDNNDTGKVKLGRPRVYQSNQRILGGRRPAIAAAATDAGTTQTLANDLRTKLIELGVVKA